jgi:DNA-binding GntR family transcriptional regulator
VRRCAPCGARAWCSWSRTAGHVVAPLSRRDIEDIFWLQASPRSWRRAQRGALPRRRSTSWNGSTRGSRQQSTLAIQSRIAAAEFAFHRAFNQASGRIKLRWFLLHVARYMPPLIYAADPHWGETAVHNHRELVAALRRRDVPEVVRLTACQFADGAKRLTARPEATGIWS